MNGYKKQKIKPHFIENAVLFLKYNFVFSVIYGIICYAACLFSF